MLGISHFLISNLSQGYHKLHQWNRRVLTYTDAVSEWPPTVPTLESNHQDDGIKNRDLQQVRDGKSSALLNGINATKKGWQETRWSLSSFVFYVRIPYSRFPSCEGTAIGNHLWSRAPTRHWICGCLILDFQPPEPWEMFLQFINYPV